MDFLRASEALLRTTQPLLPFLAPSASLPRRFLRTPSVQPHAPRTQTCSHHPRPFSSTSPAPQAERREGFVRSTTSDPIGDEFSALLDSALDPGTKGVSTAPAGRTSRLASSGAQVANSPSRLMAARQQQQQQIPPRMGTGSGAGTGTGSDRGIGGAIDEMFAAMDGLSSGSRPASASPPRSSRNSKIDIAAMLDPLNNLASAANTTSTALPPTSPPALPEPLPIKLNSSTGRTIPVQPNKGIDVGRAFRALETLCARNSVRKDFMRQRFHERGGLRRKRLRSERWRRRFKENFRGTVAMVQRMRGQGW